MFEEFAKEKPRRGLDGTTAAAIIMPWQNRAEYNDAGAYVDGNNAKSGTAENLPQQAVDEQIGDEADENEQAKKEFFEFLQGNDCWHDYLIELYENLIIGFDEFQETHKPEKYLIEAFNWIETARGRAFWDKINEEWLEFLKNKK